MYFILKISNLYSNINFTILLYIVIIIIFKYAAY